MLLAFGVFMTEAVLAYKAPWSAGFSRPQRKQVHLSMHSAAVVLALLGLLAAWKSHTLKVCVCVCVCVDGSGGGLAVAALRW
jgi:hypothetical protein